MRVKQTSDPPLTCFEFLGKRGACFLGSKAYIGKRCFKKTIGFVVCGILNIPITTFTE